MVMSTTSTVFGLLLRRTTNNNSKILLVRSLIVLLVVVFVLSQHQYVKPRKLALDKTTAITTKTLIKTKQRVYNNNREKEKVQVESRIVVDRQESSSSPELEDIDYAIAKAFLEERQAKYKPIKKTGRNAKRQQRKALKEKQKLAYHSNHSFQEQIPPLETLIADLDENITGNVQFLLDFAIVGFGKCGTTALINWLDDQPEINTIPKEALHLARKRPALMVQKLYDMKVQTLTNAAQTNSTSLQIQSQQHLVGRLQGFKNPSDVRRPESMAYLRQHWPQTKLIITLRHPVLWFQSLYNFLVNEMGRKPKYLHHTTLIGGPHKNTAYAHTGKGEFHAILSLLGKTNMTDDDELDLLKGFLQEDEILNWPQPLPNPVFLLETTQMSDQNATRSLQFRTDLKQFLGLQQELPPIPHVRPGKDRHVDESLKINLCDSADGVENEAIRQELMRISRKASQWIRRYFLQSPDVTVSSREYLEEILTTSWMQDPCSSSSRSNTATATANINDKNKGKAEEEGTIKSPVEKKKRKKVKNNTSVTKSE